jgi:hypothetical protein
MATLHSPGNMRHHIRDLIESQSMDYDGNVNECIAISNSLSLPLLWNLHITGHVTLVFQVEYECLVG